MNDLIAITVFSILFIVVYTRLAQLLHQPQPPPAPPRRHLGPSRYGHFMRIRNRIYYEMAIEADEAVERVN